MKFSQNQCSGSSAESRNFNLAGKCGGLPTAATILIFAVRTYRLVISPAQTFLFGGNYGCRFTPTCSVYAMDSVREHGAIAGTILSAKRICRCHPWGGCGHDPVPEKEFRIQNSEFRI